MIKIRPRPIDLKKLIDSINDKAATARLRYITSIPGQEMIYLAKQAEALAFIQDTTRDITKYPLLQAEIGVTSDDALALAQLWLDMSSAWVSKAAAIEAIRLRAIKTISSLTAMDDIDIVLAQITSELNEL